MMECVCLTGVQLFHAQETIGKTAWQGYMGRAQEMVGKTTWQGYMGLAQEMVGKTTWQS